MMSSIRKILLMDRRGETPTPVTVNCERIIRNDDSLKKVGFRLNQFSHDIHLSDPLPKVPHLDPLPFDSRDPILRDVGVTRIRQFITAELSVEFSRDKVEDSLAAHAESNGFHPVVEYFDSLPEWDGVARCERVLIDQCGAEDTPQAREVLLHWLMQAVQRIRRPGSKADYVLLLEGPQGCRKSTFFEAICPNRSWFKDDLADFEGKDGKSGLQGKLIISLDEFASYTGKAAAVAKSFVTRCEDHFRPAYARREVTFPRQCVFGGTVNGSDWNRDTSGARRIWVIPVEGVIPDSSSLSGRVCDTEWIVANRDLLWAEAIAKLDEVGGRYWQLSEQANAGLRVTQANSSVTSPVIELLERWLDSAAWKPTDESSRTVTMILEELELPVRARSPEAREIKNYLDQHPGEFALKSIRVPGYDTPRKRWIRLHDPEMRRVYSENKDTHEETKR